MTSVWEFLSQSGQLLLSYINFQTLIVVFALANIKGLHFMWHFRFLRAFISRITDRAPTKHLSPRCLFLPAISASRSPLLECDYNMHKSNSTYFTDLDISRGSMSLVLFRKPFNPFPGPGNFTMMLGGAQCTWRKEIKPYREYEVWTRILAWDEKWIYMVSHFVEAGSFVPTEYVMQPNSKIRTKVRDVTEKSPEKAVFASSVARYVFKNQRRTVQPELVLRECGLLPQDEVELAEVERQRQKWLPIAQLKSGWDSVHGLFEGGNTALGRYTDMWWR